MALPDPLPDRPATERSERPARRLFVTQVQETRWLTPSTIRIVLGGEDLAAFTAGPFSDRYVKLQLVPPGAPYATPFDIEQIRATFPREQWPRTRTYSVRAWDSERRRLTIDFVYHGDSGIAGPWATNGRLANLWVRGARLIDPW